MLKEVLVQHIGAHVPLHRGVRPIDELVSQTGPGVIGHHPKLSVDEPSPRTPGCGLSSAVLTGRDDGHAVIASSPLLKTVIRLIRPVSKEYRWNTTAGSTRRSPLRSNIC